MKNGKSQEGFSHQKYRPTTISMPSWAFPISNFGAPIINPTNRHYCNPYFIIGFGFGSSDLRQNYGKILTNNLPEKISERHSTLTYMSSKIGIHVVEMIEENSNNPSRDTWWRLLEFSEDRFRFYINIGGLREDGRDRVGRERNHRKANDSPTTGGPIK